MPRKPPEPMTLAQVMQTLEAAAKPATASIYRRHGADGEVWGVAYGELGKLEKRIRRDHELALELWETGVHDARALAFKLVEPDRLTRRQLSSWCKASSNHILMGHLGGLIGRRQDGLELACAWIDGRGEWRRAAGWVAVAELALRGALDEGLGRGMLERIGRELPEAYNRERHTMNGALIAIGGTIQALHPLAVQVAEALGPVDVDHGATDCKTPSAVPYMKKMWDRAAKKKA